MTFAIFMALMAGSVGLTAWVTWAIVSEHYRRLLAERDAALLARRCTLLDKALARKQQQDAAELQQLREELRRTGPAPASEPPWAPGYRDVFAERLSQQLDHVAELEQQLGRLIEDGSRELTLFRAMAAEHSRVRPTGSDHPEK